MSSHANYQNVLETHIIHEHGFDLYRMHSSTVLTLNIFFIIFIYFLFLALLFECRKCLHSCVMFPHKMFHFCLLPTATQKMIHAIN